MKLPVCLQLQYFSKNVYSLQLFPSLDYFCLSVSSNDCVKVLKSPNSFLIRMVCLLDFRSVMFLHVQVR